MRSADRAQEYYRIINSEAKKLTRLIENILDFSRMEAGLRPYTLAPAEIGELVRHVIGVMQPQFVQSGLPPNWQGVMRVSKSADRHVVVLAKTQSSGDFGGSTRWLSWTRSG